MQLDKTKIDDLLEELSSHLSYEDMFEIKKEINFLHKN